MRYRYLIDLIIPGLMRMWCCVKRIGPCMTSSRGNSAAKNFCKSRHMSSSPCASPRGGYGVLPTIQELGRVDCESEHRHRSMLIRAALFNVAIMWKGCQISRSANTMGRLTRPGSEIVWPSASCIFPISSVAQNCNHPSCVVSLFMKEIPDLVSSRASMTLVWIRISATYKLKSAVF